MSRRVEEQAIHSSSSVDLETHASVIDTEARALSSRSAVTDTYMVGIRRIHAALAVSIALLMLICTSMIAVMFRQSISSYELQLQLPTDIQQNYPNIYAFPPSQRDFMSTQLSEFTNRFPNAANLTASAMLWTSASYAAKGDARAAMEACPKHKTLLIGVLSTAYDHSFARRQVLRLIYNIMRPVSSVDVRFVVGRPSSASHNLALRLEQALHGDLIFLEMQENMNDGKTFMYFKTVGERIRDGSLRSYDFVSKADDDTFIHLPNAVAYLRRIGYNAENRVKSNMYVGRLWDENNTASPTMAGMFYTISLDLVEWLSTTNDITEDKWTGHEDQKLADWIFGSGRKINMVNNNQDMGDSPFHGGIWVLNYSDTSIAIHQCKDLDRLWDVATYYLSQPSPNQTRMVPLDDTPECLLPGKTLAFPQSPFAI